MIRHTNTNSKFFDQIIMFKVKIAHKNTKLFVFYGNDQPSVRRTQQGGRGEVVKILLGLFRSQARIQISISKLRDMRKI